MDNDLQRKNEENPLNFVKIVPDDQPHIWILNDNLCLTECDNKPCTYVCPSRVYYWEDQSIKILHTRCIECGACIWGCPYENINWNYPRGGYGICYQY